MPIHDADAGVRLGMGHRPVRQRKLPRLHSLCTGRDITAVQENALKHRAGTFTRKNCVSHVSEAKRRPFLWTTQEYEPEIVGEIDCWHVFVLRVPGLMVVVAAFVCFYCGTDSLLLVSDF